MDGVSVKISEKYKPPPKVSIPQTITNRLNSNGYPLGIFDYDFTLEQNVIKRIEEWKRVREMVKVNRQSRLRKLEIEQARELEEKQKQLLTSVSYPNADEISSGDEGESDNSTRVTANSTAPTVTPVNTCNTPESLNHQAFNQQNFNTILKPTVLPENTIKNVFNNSPTAMWKTNLSTNLKSNIGGKINYSDFENDTSSPFDNVELKTINDLDILAQVYNIPHSNITENLLQNSDIPQKQINTDSTITINQSDNVNNTILSNLKTENKIISIQPNNLVPLIYWKNNNSNSIAQNTIGMQQQLGQNFEIPNTSVNHYYQLQQNYTNMNGSLSSNPQQQQQFITKSENYYVSGYGNVPVNQNYQYTNFQSNNVKDKISNTIGYTNYVNFNNQHNYNAYNTGNFQPPTSNSPSITYENVNQYRSSNIDQTLPSQVPSAAFNNFVQRDNPSVNNITLKNLTIEENTVQSIKNKSKSVPDILKELDDEVRDSENRRARNHSQTLEDYSQKCSKPKEKKSDKLPESFLKLSPSSQNLIKNISSMGFPIERVSKIAEKFGTDDKKIFEHLIPLSELLDLGFDEDRISEALLKFDNNKDKALDYLIS